MGKKKRWALWSAAGIVCCMGLFAAVAFAGGGDHPPSNPRALVQGGSSAGIPAILPPEIVSESLREAASAGDQRVYIASSRDGLECVLLALSGDNQSPVGVACDTPEVLAERGIYVAASHPDSTMTIAVRVPEDFTSLAVSQRSASALKAGTAVVHLPEGANVIRARGPSGTITIDLPDTTIADRAAAEAVARP